MTPKIGLFLAVSALLAAATAAGGGDDDNAVGEGKSPMRPECTMWSKLENKTLSLQNQGHANCTTNEQCTGFSCDGLYQDKELSFGMRVLPCQDTPGVEIYGYAPQFNANNFSHVFTHQSSYTVPGALLNLSAISGDTPYTGKELSGKLEVHIEKSDGKSLLVGLTLKGCINKTCIFSRPVFNQTEIPVPECSSHLDHSIKVNSVCSMHKLNDCGKNMVCNQDSDGSDLGICECLPGFVLQDDQTCLSKKEDSDRSHPRSPSASPDLYSYPQPKISIKPPDSSPSSPSTASAEGSGTAIAVTAVAVLVLVALAAGTVFIVFRTRLVPRLMARLTNTPYEDIVIGRQGRSESQQNVVA